MRLFIILFIYLPGSYVFAATVSMVELTVVDQGCKGCDRRYRLVLDDRRSTEDEIHEQDAAGAWKSVYKGTVTGVSLPKGARVDALYGPRASAPGLLSHGDYDLLDDEKSAGLRVKSGTSLVLLTHHGAAKVEWPGEIVRAWQLHRDADVFTGTSYFLFAVEGRERSATYVMVNGPAAPHKLTDDFRHDDMGIVIEDGRVWVDVLNKVIDPEELAEFERAFEQGRARAKATGSFEDRLAADIKKHNTLQTWFRDPTKSETLDELIALLDEREPLASMRNKEELVARAIRGMLTREFPRLLELEKTDAAVKKNADRLVAALTQLWLARQTVSGGLIRNTLIQRLEAAVEKRTRCELALLTVKGTGAHAFSYFRGEALRAMNALQRKLYGKP